ncbi:hypothetical protein FIBSPDRAFT_884475 [Athelia psychrophila]|uniref:Uncharacterized protein n=1 Tax=Athelia psychrophila TaxID=1759441 RepID=A0A166T655_9AGAM|nr:hypothetical protein FIBSPDRAFT_884475 [Fibularhizoctonia sp. CBS 109695]
MAGHENIAQIEEADQDGEGRCNENGLEWAATPMMQELLSSTETDLRAIDAGIADFATTTEPAVTPTNTVLITTLSTTLNGPDTTLSTTTNSPITTLFSTTNPVTTSAELPVPVLTPGSNFQDNDSDGEETPVTKPWHLSTQCSWSSSVVALDIDNSIDFIIDTDTTLQQLIASVPPPPLEHPKLKITPAASTLVGTFSRPGFIPGCHDRPESSIPPPPPIFQSLLPALTTGKVTHPAPRQLQLSVPVGATPNYLIWTATECQAFKWLVSDAEGWGGLGVDCQAAYGDIESSFFPPPSEITEWMRPVVRPWQNISIGDVDSFAVQYHRWWQVQQPTEYSQCIAPTLPIPPPSMDWTVLQRPATDASTSWRAAAQDFYLAMQWTSTTTNTTVVPLGPFSFPPLSTQHPVPPNPGISMPISSGLAAAVGKSSFNELVAVPAILPAKSKATTKSKASKPPLQVLSTTMMGICTGTHSMSALKNLVQ